MRWADWRNTPMDGSPIEVLDTDANWKQDWGWRYMKTFARPLVEVTNETVLKETIITPLLEMIRVHREDTISPSP